MSKRPSATALEYISSSRRSFLAIALAVPLAACGSTADDDDASPKARIRVVHVGADAGAVDIHAAGSTTPLISNLGYGEVTPYLELEPGTYNLQVRPTGRLDAPLYETGDVTFEIGAEITAVATGFVQSTRPEDSFRILALKDNWDAPAAGQLAVRIVHASADAPTVGIDLGNDHPGAPEIADLQRFGDTGAGGVAIPAGQSLQIGIAAGGATATAFTTPALPEGGQLYVLAFGRLADSPRVETGFALMAVGPDGIVGVLPQNPFVYALHASPDAPAVDIRAGQANLVANLSYGQLGRFQVPPGDYNVDFYPAGGASSVATAAVPGLEAGESYLAVAAGFVAPQAEERPFGLLAARDELLDDDEAARAMVIHASPDAPAVDISTVSGAHLDLPLLVEGLRFGQMTTGEGLPVPPANLNIGIAQAGSQVPLATFGIQTERRQRAMVIAAGALSPLAGQRPFSLMVVDTTALPWTVASLSPN